MGLIKVIFLSTEPEISDSCRKCVINLLHKSRLIHTLYSMLKQHKKIPLIGMQWTSWTFVSKGTPFCLFYFFVECLQCLLLFIQYSLCSYRKLHIFLFFFFFSVYLPWAFDNILCLIPFTSIKIGEHNGTTIEKQGNSTVGARYKIFSTHSLNKLSDFQISRVFNL